MIRLKRGVQVLLGCTLVYATACGGSTSPDDGGALGSAGFIGVIAGATAGAGHSSSSAGALGQSGPGDATGGSSDSTGSTGVAGSEPGTGDTGSGGEASTGGPPGNAAAGNGAGGMSGVVGAPGTGGQNACPASAPAENSMCTTATRTGQNCLYVGESCACRAAIVIAPRPGAGAAGASSGGASPGAGGAASSALTWRCTGSGAACPATAPTTGAMCSNATGAGGAGAGVGAAALDCPYPDGKTCRCTNRRWECTEPPPPACPAKEPSGSCSAVQACSYGTAAMRVRCACDGAAWACDMPGGAAPRCTAKAQAALATGDACTGIGECTVLGGAGRTCVCNGKTVTCT